MFSLLLFNTVQKEGSSHWNKARKQNPRKSKDLKARTKMFPICRWHCCLHGKSSVIYKTTVRTSKWIWGCFRLQVNIKKSVVFLYTSRIYLENENFKIPLNKRYIISILKTLHSTLKNHRTVLWELFKNRYIPYSWIGRLDDVLLLKCQFSPSWSTAQHSHNQNCAFL